MTAQFGNFCSALHSFDLISSFSMCCDEILFTEKPFTMEVIEAPDPDDIFWGNVGRMHKDLQLGMLASICITVVTCFLWTIPVSFVASLSSVEALRKEIPALDSMLDVLPFLVPVFEVLAPQFLVILNALLPIVRCVVFCSFTLFLNLSVILTFLCISTGRCWVG